MPEPHLQTPVSNGNPREQALIRRWWHAQCQCRGELVREYFVSGYYADAIWFFDSPNHGVESPGRDVNRRFPIEAKNIVLCEAKIQFSPELIGQALTYAKLLELAGGNVVRTRIFSEQLNPKLREVAEILGLEVDESYAQHI